MLHRIRSLILKELQALLRDRQSRGLLVVPVVLQLILFPLAATLEVKNNTLAVLNQDTGREATELLQRFAKAGAFSRFLMIHSQAELRRTIEERRALLVVQFPSDFSREVATGRPAPLQVILDGRRSNSGQIALGYLQEVVDSYFAERSAARPEPGASTLIVRHWFNANLHYYWFIVPSLVAIITTLSTLVVTALSIAREREHGTFDQLLVSPLTPGMIMVGKAVPALLVAAFQATIILLGGVFAYRIPFQGSLLLLYGSMMVYVIALSGFGLLISSFCATQQQAFLGAFSFMMPAIMLSGYVSPVENMPQWLQAVTWFNPLRHFIVIVKGLFLKAMPPADVLHNLWPLLIIGILTMAAANLSFRRRIG